MSAGLRFHSHLSGGLRLRNYCAVAGNHEFSSRFSVFASFCGGYSNKVKRLRRLSGNFQNLFVRLLLHAVMKQFVLFLRCCGLCDYIELKYRKEFPTCC